ncbi:F-box protein dre-1 [Ditylenchus destructor]|nr:F-box protein dre-1 [Ditylenchus destructor]
MFWISIYRKQLYAQVYEYTAPLYHPSFAKYEFREPRHWHNCQNPWKESFIQLRHGVHVRPRQSSVYDKQPGRRIAHFESIEPALKFVESRPDLEKLIFLHTGHHMTEHVVIENAVQLIGASGGTEHDIVQNVTLETPKGTTISFNNGCLNAYLGYFMLIFNPEKPCPLHTPHMKRYILLNSHETDVITDYCIISSSSLVESTLFKPMAPCLGNSFIITMSRANQQDNAAILQQARDTGLMRRIQENKLHEDGMKKIRKAKESDPERNFISAISAVAPMYLYDSKLIDIGWLKNVSLIEIMEILRDRYNWEIPVQHQSFQANAEDIHVCGETIPADSVIVFCWSRDY